jgi:heme/copper-type cytochrome/quinol oxidase subunit 2
MDLFIFLTRPLALNKATLEVRATVALSAPNDGKATDEVTLHVVLVHVVVVVVVVVVVLVLVFHFQPCRRVMPSRANQ